MFQFVENHHHALDTENGFDFTNIFYATFQNKIQTIIESYCDLHVIDFSTNSALLAAEIAGSVVSAGIWYKQHPETELKETVDSVMLSVDRILNIYFPVPTN